MEVFNLHHRVLSAPAAAVGVLLDSLASPTDALWPRDRWPPIRLDRPLQVGAIGGHGPIRYTVESYLPGNAVTFRFTGPKGFLGTHGFAIEDTPDGTRLTHAIVMRAAGLASLSWLLVFRPLHDALIEDALDKAAQHVGTTCPTRAWSLWVRFLRRAVLVVSSSNRAT